MELTICLDDELFLFLEAGGTGRVRGIARSLGFELFAGADRVMMMKRIWR